MKLKVIAIVECALEILLKGLVQRLEELRDQRKNSDNPDHSTIKIS